MAQVRLNKILKELNITLDRVDSFLSSKGVKLELNPNSKLDEEHYNILLEEFGDDIQKKKEIEEKSKKIKEEIQKNLVDSEIKQKEEKQKEEKETKQINTKKRKLSGPNIIEGEILDLSKFEKKPKKKKKIEEKKEDTKREKTIKKDKKGVIKEETKKEETKKEETKKEEIKEEEIKKVETKFKKLSGPNIIEGETLDLSKFEEKPKKKKEEKEKKDNDVKKKRKRIVNKKVPLKPSKYNNRKKITGKKNILKPELTEEEISKQIKETLEKLTKSGGKSGVKHRRAKRDEHKEKAVEEQKNIEKEKKIIKITEFITVQDLAKMMDVQATEVISSCMMLGIMTTLNQRLDQETISIIVEEFDFKAEFVEEEEEEKDIVDTEENMIDRPPVIVVMGHVDHGKTSLLDHIRNTTVIAGESGGITQHIGAYHIELKNKKKLTFLDTPGHEAFTAMRARGAKVTDIAIIVIAADDSIMPQTKEAISHAQAAEIPFIIAINKIDKPNANPDKVKESLSSMNILVEDWGGNIQCQEISAKKGTGVRELLDKVLLESEMLELKANPNRLANGTVVEASLDKGRGFISNILVQGGTLKVGDFLLAGTNTGKVKAMFDERGHNVKEATPSTPVAVLGLDGAPTSGDTFKVYEDEKEAKQIAIKKDQMRREQNVRVNKHITLDEIGRRIAVGDFKELNLIIKGDVDGSIEAISDSLQKLSTEEIQVNILHKGVGQITESDILLATTSNAIVIGFQVRPSVPAKKLAEKESIELKYYSIIYDIIGDIKDAMEGMLSPDFVEEIICNVEIREIFKVSKVGTIAGCMVLDGKIKRNTKIRLIRDNVVVYTGELGSLKRFKDDVKEVSKGYECGLNISNYNDIKSGDIIEGYEMIAVKKKL